MSPDPSFFYYYGLTQYGFVPKPAANVYGQFVKGKSGALTAAEHPGPRVGQAS